MEQHNEGLGGNHHSAGWSNESVSAAEIEAYKKHWAERGFPDVDRKFDSRWTKGVGLLNDPVTQETPEARLWCSVLIEAFADIERGLQPKPSLRQQLDAKDAAEWLESHAKTEGSFEWVCGMLNLETDYMRKMVTNRSPIAGRSRHYVSKVQKLSSADQSRQRNHLGRL